MFRIFLSFSLLLFLSTPAFAQAAPEDTCAAPSDATTDYVQVGEDMIMMECPPQGGGACTCHAPAGEDGKCRVYVCNSDGSPVETKKPKAVSKPKAGTQPAAEKPKKKVKHKKPAATPPASAGDKVEDSRRP